MPSGGHANSGPTRDPDALRRDRKDDKRDWTVLPAAGREGEAAPAWPLTKPTKRETVLWAAEWRRPQAIQWEADGLVLEVALYVRALRLAESPRATPPLRTLVRQYMDGLGISLDGLLRKHWRIEEAAPQEATVRTDDPDRASAKQRFTTIEGGAARSA